MGILEHMGGKKIALLNIVQDNLPTNCFFNETQPKRIIILHHTAGASAQSSIQSWRNAKNKIATTVVIDRDGTVYQAFPFNKWGHALGIKQKVFNQFKIPNINTRLDQISIQIEIASWGQLTFKNGKYYNYVNKEVDAENVQLYNPPYRGYSFYEKYTDEQIEALRQLILKLHKDFPSISLNYRPEMWNVNRNALVGTWGIWTHTSFRSDKVDCHPQPELIEMLKNLKK